MSVKKCTKCKKVKHTNRFYKSSLYNDGYRTICIQCWSEYGKTKCFEPDQKLMEKRCGKCRDTKCVSDFFHSKRNRDGYSCWCKQCFSSRVENMEGRVKAWKSNAKTRKIPFDITLDYLNTLPRTCYYTDVPLVFEMNKPNTISLDRLDSSKGYVKGNVVFCSSDINYMKSDFTYKQFLSLCRKVVLFHDK